MSHRPAIEQYDDYRKFILDFLNYRKSEGKPGSFRWISSLAGFKSPNFVHLVTQGKRHLTNDSAIKISEALKLSSSEKKYFLNLVGFNKSKSSIEKEMYVNELFKTKTLDEITPLKKEQFEYYANWYNIIIREIINFQPEFFDEEKIAGLMIPDLKPFQVKEAFHILQRLGLISKNNKSWLVHDKNIGFADRVTRTGLTLFHKKMIQLGMESLERFKTEERDVTGVTTALSDEDLIKAKAILQNARKEILQLSDSKCDNKKIFQLNIQLFPVTKRIIK